MKHLPILLTLLLIGALPVQLNTSTSDVAKIEGDYDDFHWIWPKSNSENIQQDFTNTQGTINLTNYNVRLMMTNENFGVGFNIGTNETTVSVGRVTCAITWSNLVSVSSGVYKLETQLLSANTNDARTIGQGKVSVIPSLFP